jgi:hypothetical protein
LSTSGILLYAFTFKCFRRLKLLKGTHRRDAENAEVAQNPDPGLWASSASSAPLR